MKPENFLIGASKKQHLIYIIDYGLAKRFRDPRSGDHIPFKDGKNLTGTARYASLNTHLGIEQSRRDDLESIGLLLMYFHKGALPWQGVHTHTKKEKYKQIRAIKLNTTIEALCKGFPDEFATYLNYCRKLQFTENPDYQMLHGLFKGLFDKMGYESDSIYDWTLHKSKEGSKKDECKKEIVIEEEKHHSEDIKESAEEGAHLVRLFLPPKPHPDTVQKLPISFVAM